MASPAVGPPQTLPANFTGWDKPTNAPPQTLPPDFNGWDKTPTVAPKPSLMSQIGTGAENLGKGAVKGLLSTESNIGSAIHSIPGVGPALIPQAGLDTEKAYAQTHGTMQGIGKGVEQAGEFLAPGLGEESALAKVAEEAPRLMPAARIGYSALTSGAVNKLQGGGFGSGALAGGVAGTVGEGMRALAPHIAESALNIRKLDRAYGKGKGAIGRSILDETHGLRPGSVAESAQARLDELNPELNAAADRASIRRAPTIRGFLQPSATEIPLGETPMPGDMPGGFFPAQPYEPQNVGEARIIRQRNGQIMPFADRNVEFPDASGKLPPARNYNGRMLSQQPTRRAFTTSAIGDMPESQEFSGPGVLLRKPEMSASVPPVLTPNTSASLSGSRGILNQAAGTASRQGERTTLSQLQPMATHLGERMGGEEIPENITPRELLDLKRGFGNEFIHRWNPETMHGVKGTAGRVYGNLASEFNRVVPEGEELNGRISRLIPVARRAESAELNAPTAQRIAHRVAAHTGALAGAVGGGYEGYRHGGMGTGLLGAGIGLMAPEILASPGAEMMAARTAYSPATRGALRGLAGAALQLQNKGKKSDSK